MQNWQTKFSKIEKLRNRFLEIGEKSSTPLYLYDAEEVQTNLRTFKNAFAKSGLQPRIFYAIKSNPYLDLLKTVVEAGDFLDASSQRELELALEAKAEKIIYTGPAKTKEDFELIVQHSEKITVNFDNFREIQLLNEVAEQKAKKMRCGVRVYTGIQKGWSKFGIPLDELKSFFKEAEKQSNLHFCGIHFHISLNKNPAKYLSALLEIAQYLKDNFTSSELRKFEYIDIGGGFYPEAFEGIYSWNQEQIMDFGNGTDDYIDEILADKFQPRYQKIPVEPIENFAEAIAKVWKEKILPILPQAELYVEPGRYISHSAMHILLKVIDLKKEHFAILDGGNNMVGWEKYQFFYYTPIFNLTHFSLKQENPYILYGSLCTPDDLWGYYFYGEKIEKNDLFLLAFQGAYTYTLAQNFIKAVPAVYNLSQLNYE